MGAEAMTERVEIIKPRNDKREYRRIVLQNNLQVLPISDPETDKCAASMDVRVGAFSDPEGLEGLAHFFEHMLFYASEKYPLEDSYSTYISELQKHLSVKDHPYHKFSTGNRETLEVRPKKGGLDTRQELLQLYNSANLMHLVIYSKDGLDVSESLVRIKFQDIRNTDRSCITFAGQPCDSESLQILAKAVPIKQVHKLSFVWPITPEIRHYKERPIRYLSHLIGHEGEGSLFYILKKLGGCC